MGIAEDEVASIAATLRIIHGVEATCGLSGPEIQEVVVDQSIGALPSGYVEFLRQMGKSAGPILRGTDAFYPNILGIKADALKVLEEDGQAGLFSERDLVFAMHQGYQIYWMSDIQSSNPAVFMHQEGTAGIIREWDSFTSFLRHYFNH